jgi:hypothetical protein
MLEKSMNDSEIEDLLRKYRPVGPPAELRQRILGTTRVPRIWPWASAAAALLVLGLTFQFATRSETAAADLNLGPSAVERVTEDLTNMLGGDIRARELAEFIVVEQQVHSETTTASMQPLNGAGGVQR